MNAEVTSINRERTVKLLSGWVMLPVVLLLIIGGPAVFIYSIAAGANTVGHPLWALFALGILMEIAGIIFAVGLFTLQPNEARVLILFGEYKGTVRASGFWWGNPFYSNGGRQNVAALQVSAGEGKLGGVPGGRQGGARSGAAKAPSRHKMSLRARTLNGERLKVNDKRGNPVEIAAIVIWRVQDTAQAAFDVDDYEKYVETQSESALRHLASCYSYDHGEDNETTLRSGVEEVSQALRKELQERLAKAGVVVEETRLTHLAYAPEIAQAMLRRQQAEAVIAARQKIVQGAVSMVDMALKELADKHVVQLDDERRAAMVSNLMVVLCGESEVHPVLNTGTLYT
ncbi:MAG TPA: SPFH domain-containing protein [Candidatus Paceibacterota bacterium]|nr:SPFH domain-containing protein [Verrucomicrobiota bacterium]HSA11393.1 SPFH domain-containing protein [Candidatus Paceibacterota bacterium]